MNAIILMDETEAGHFLGVKPSTLAAWRYRGTGPMFRKIGRLVRYLRSDLEEYLERQGRQSTSEYRVSLKNAGSGECSHLHSDTKSDEKINRGKGRGKAV